MLDRVFNSRRIAGRLLCWAAVLWLLPGTVPAPAQSKAPIRWPDPDWPTASPRELGLDQRLLHRARQYALNGGGSGCVIYRGRLVLRWGDPRRRYALKSTTKSIGVTALGLALADGKVRLEDRARRFHPRLGDSPPENRRTGWLDSITLLHLATHTAGFEKPGGFGRLLFRPGTRWHYSDGGPNYLAECLTLVYREDLKELLFRRVFAPLGISRRDLSWRKNAYRPPQIEGIPRREFGSGISANVDAMARIGYLYLRRGRWKARQILPEKFVDLVRRPHPRLTSLKAWEPKHYGQASAHYGLLWWNNADGTLASVPRDAYWAWGLFDSVILVVPSLDLVVARAGRSFRRQPGWSGHYDVLRPFFEPLVAAAGFKPPKAGKAEPAGSAAGQTAPRADRPPYPPSPVIRTIRWAPAETIRRRAPGSDNWPLTWGDDDRLYTAYGDGRGFRPFAPRKLSLGLAVVSGPPNRFRGENLPADIEQTGDGPQGPKASSLLMVRGVLYMWVRNRGNSQLAWSHDRGRHWHWARWKFSTSFGYPVFLNFGPNYAGARDRYVYVYSHDADSAYRRADRMVLARVPLHRIADRAAYEFFVRLDDSGPVWTSQIARRGAVFVHPGHCYRSSLSYHPKLRRYLWCQTGLGRDPRFRGGLAIYDAPEPWGPWTTVYYASVWDVGPGETSSLPPKWFSADGRTVHLVFSGNDSFSVRRGELVLRD